MESVTGEAVGCVESCERGLGKQADRHPGGADLLICGSNIRVSSLKKTELNWGCCTCLH